MCRLTLGWLKLKLSMVTFTGLRFVMFKRERRASETLRMPMFKSRLLAASPHSCSSPCSTWQCKFPWYTCSGIFIAVTFVASSKSLVHKALLPFEVYSRCIKDAASPGCRIVSGLKCEILKLGSSIFADLIMIGTEKLLETMMARIVEVTRPGVDRNLVLSFMKPSEPYSTFALYGTSRVAETASVSFTISCSLPFTAPSLEPW
mmetsp:Transcript_46041/g.109429  ORF Transcript_46041/g.109429 Transcript_46041/m.109429 type:complete len:204 (+) Transcript_46041:319-930(+)